jgi:hypothetical protein
VAIIILSHFSGLDRTVARSATLHLVVDVA